MDRHCAARSNVQALCELGNAENDRILPRRFVLPRVRVVQVENASFEDDGNVIVVVVVVENTTLQRAWQLLCDRKRAMFPRRVGAPDVTVHAEQRGDDSGRVPVDKRSDRHR
ncbi:hypothetical protein ALC62_10966 [Cyphomyrmex costatus]|uniref:Uncharacterized protein n=1 Tax=Cyphomyrmex costatus TaxID=456900 RepID=A0A151ID49_9HYME|nr:hypothetical protein ALC62_10966 [Cyphomyrmex costatus]